VKVSNRPLLTGFLFAVRVKVNGPPLDTVVVAVVVVIDDVDDGPVVANDVVTVVEVVIAVEDVGMVVDVDSDDVDGGDVYTYTAATVLPTPTVVTLTLYDPGFCELHTAMYDPPEGELKPSVTTDAHPTGNVTELHE